MAHDDTYADRWITCDADALHIRGYYFPWGTKRIPYGSIRGVRRVAIGAFTGKARIWGTANPRYWVSLDPRRPGKSTALILDLGAAIMPFITPDDPDAVQAAIREHTGLDVAATDGGRAPIV